MDRYPNLQFVQFIDGDCELVGQWLTLAARELEARPTVAVVCGRRRERFPEKSLYNRLADLEWETPVGEVKSCGGDAMIRAEAFKAVGGLRRPSPPAKSRSYAGGCGRKNGRFSA